MPDLGNAVLRLIVNGKGFKQGLSTAEQQTTKFAAKGEKQVGRVRGAFGKLGKEVDNALGKIPIIGSSLAALPGPAKAVAAGIALVGFALAKMVGRIVDLEKALRPMVERSGLASDSLQLLAAAAERAGSEDGLEGVTDSAQELQLRLAEVVQDGTGPAKEAFEKLGLSAQDLIDKSPEDMLLAVVAALQNVTNEADRKFLADELLGGSSEKLAGLLNLTNEELGLMLGHLADTGDFMSGEALADAKAYSGSVDELKNSFGSMATQIGSVLIPILTGLVEALNSMGKGLDWVAKVMGWAKDDTNEFTEAADEMSETLAKGAAPAFEATTEAAEDATVEIEEVGKASLKTTKSVKTLTTATEEVTDATKLWAAANRASSQQMIEDSALRLRNLLADYAEDIQGQGDAIRAKETAEADHSAWQKEMARANARDRRTARAEEEAFLREHYDRQADALRETREKNAAEAAKMAEEINAELAKIEREIEIGIRFSGGLRDAQGARDPARTTGVTFNPDGSVSTSESTSSHSQNLYLDDSGNAFYDKNLNNPQATVSSTMLTLRWATTTYPAPSTARLCAGRARRWPQLRQPTKARR